MSNKNVKIMIDILDNNDYGKYFPLYDINWRGLTPEEIYLSMKRIIIYNLYGITKNAKLNVRQQDDKTIAKDLYKLELLFNDDDDEKDKIKKILLNKNGLEEYVKNILLKYKIRQYNANGGGFKIPTNKNLIIKSNTLTNFDQIQYNKIRNFNNLKKNVNKNGTTGTNNNGTTVTGTNNKTSNNKNKLNNNIGNKTRNLLNNGTTVGSKNETKKGGKYIWVIRPKEKNIKK